MLLCYCYCVTNLAFVTTLLSQLNSFKKSKSEVAHCLVHADSGNRQMISRIPHCVLFTLLVLLSPSPVTAERLVLFLVYQKTVSSFDNFFSNGLSMAHRELMIRFWRRLQSKLLPELWIIHDSLPLGDRQKTERLRCVRQVAALLTAQV